MAKNLELEKFIHEPFGTLVSAFVYRCSGRFCSRPKTKPSLVFRLLLLLDTTVVRVVLCFAFRWVGGVSLSLDTTVIPLRGGVYAGDPR